MITLSGGGSYPRRYHKLYAAGDTVRQVRFVNLPPETPAQTHRRMILLDNILRYCLDDIF